MIRVGQVIGAYGTEGAVKVIPLTDFDDRFSTGSALLLEGCERQVEWSRTGQPGLVVKLKGIENRTIAELHRGRYLEVPEDSARALDDGHYYHHQVVGLVVQTGSGKPLGTIAEVLERPGNDGWGRREGLVEDLVPDTRGAVRELDAGRDRTG